MMNNTKTTTSLVLLAALGAVVVITTGTTKIYGIEDQANPQRSLAKIILVKQGNLGPQDKGDFDAEVTGNHPSPTPVNLS
jgi:hypothetical protein